MELADAVDRSDDPISPAYKQFVLQFGNAKLYRQDSSFVRWGDPIGTHGADVISVNVKTGGVTLWDSKFRSGNVRVQPSKTFTDPTGARLANAISEAESTIKTNTTLPPEIRAAAMDNLQNNRVTTRTVGAGNARNSTLQ